MPQNSTICGLVTRSSSYQAKHRKPIGERASSKLTRGDMPLRYAATKPKARSPMGFLLSAVTRQGALANGLNRLNPQKTGTCNLQEHAAKPVREGLQKIVRPSGDKRLINRLNLGVMRAVGQLLLIEIKGWQRAETLRFTLARAWENEK